MLGNFGEEHGSEDVVTEDDWRKFHISEVWKKTCDGVTEDRDKAMDPVELEVKTKPLPLQIQTKSMSLGQSMQIQQITNLSVEL